MPAVPTRKRKIRRQPEAEAPVAKETGRKAGAKGAASKAKPKAKAKR